MRNIIPISLLAFAMLSSCGGKEGTTPDPAPEVNPLSEYRILYEQNDRDDSLSMDISLSLREIIKEKTGLNLKVLSAGKSAGAEKEIVVGRTQLDYAQAFYNGAFDEFDWSIRMNGGKILVSAGGSWALKSAVEHFGTEVLAKTFKYKEGAEYKGNIRGEFLFPRCEGSNLRILDENIWQYDGANNAAAWEAVGENCTNAVRGRNIAAYLQAYLPDLYLIQEYSDKMKAVLEPEINRLGMVSATPGSTNYTPVYYNTSALELKTVKYAKYGDYTVPGTSTKISPGASKSYTIAVFKHKATAKEFMVVSTHLWWKSESAQTGSDVCREAESKVLIAAIADMKKVYDVPVFVVGDMNCKLSSTAMAQFTKNEYKPAWTIATVYGDGSNGWHPCDQYKFCREYKSEMDKFANTTASDGWKWSSLNGKHDIHDNGNGCIDQFFLLDRGSKVEIKRFERIHAYFTIMIADHYPNYADIKLK